MSMNSYLDIGIYCDASSFVTIPYISRGFYRAMHFSAYARSWDRMSSVRLSVRL